MTQRPFSLAVVGADHANKRGPGRRFELAMCKPGERVELRPEPKNPADPRAVAVFTRRGVQIGYLTAERCGWIGSQINAGREVTAIFQRQTTFGAYIRIAFDGQMPDLPPERNRDTLVEPDPQDFYPDPTWDDD